MAIKLNPNDVSAFINRGHSKKLLNDKKGACLDYSKAGELGYEQAYDFIKEYCNEWRIVYSLAILNKVLG